MANEHATGTSGTSRESDVTDGSTDFGTALRKLEPDEWDKWYDTLLRAFGGVQEAAEERELWNALSEHGRFLAAWEGDACVGTAGAFSFRLTVPGGASVPAAGVTGVGVAATHRRRGVLTSMMRRQLDDVRSWGEPQAVRCPSRRRGGRAEGDLAEEAEVDVDPLGVLGGRVAETEEEVLAVGLGGVQGRAVEEGGGVGELALGTGDAEGGAVREGGGAVLGQPVNGVSFGHGSVPPPRSLSSSAPGATAGGGGAGSGGGRRWSRRR
ncbi:N-acetyltransferase Eis [Streptomyces griseomycini]